MIIPEKPKNRSKLRLYLGRKYFMLRRYVHWYFSKDKFAKSKGQNLLPYKVYSHETPLLRKLQGVDMKLQYNKLTNLRIAIKRINHILIKPGETFSYWKLIGKPTYRKGYLDGLVLKPNGAFEAGVGGGLCQLSNMIYWITLHTPLKVVERYRHSHDIFPDVNRTQPFGSGATCVYNYLDLQIYNPTDRIFQLNFQLGQEILQGEWCADRPLNYKYEIYEKEHSFTPAFWGGYIRNNTIHRKIFDMHNNFLKDEFITENHAIMMYEPLLK